MGLPQEIIDLYSIGYYTGRSFPEGSAICPIRNEAGEELGYFGFSIDKEVAYPTKFNIALNLLGVDHLSNYSDDAQYIVANPIDVFVAAAYTSPSTIATVQPVPSSQQIQLISSTDNASFIYLYREEHRTYD